MPAFGGGPKCAECDKTVYAVEEVKALDKSYHKSCFRCKKCNKVLMLGQYNAKDHNTPYCEQCYRIECMKLRSTGGSTPTSPNGSTTEAGNFGSPPPADKEASTPHADPPPSTKPADPSPSTKPADPPPTTKPADPPPSKEVPPSSAGPVATGTDEEKVTHWFEAVSGEKKPADKDFQEWLKDGGLICRSANKIQEGTIKNINPPGMPFKEMENVTAFLNACKAWGVMEKDTFSTIDLTEGKNLKAFCMCIMNLDGVLRGKGIGNLTAVPMIGVVQKTHIEDHAREKVAVTQASGYRPDVGKD